MSPSFIQFIFSNMFLSLYPLPTFFSFSTSLCPVSFNKEFNEWVLIGWSCSGVKHVVCRWFSLQTRLPRRVTFFLWICSHSSFPLGLSCCWSLWPVSEVWSFVYTHMAFVWTIYQPVYASLGETEMAQWIDIEKYFFYLVDTYLQVSTRRFGLIFPEK